MTDPLLNWFINNYLMLLTYFGAFLIVAPFIISFLALIAFGKLWQTNPLSCLFWCLIAGPSSFYMKVLATLLSPLLSLISVIFNVDRLPGPLKWFHTHDDTLDALYKEGWGRQPTILGRWFWRMAWIIRNPAYGWMYYVMGRSIFGKVTVVKSDVLWTKEEGWSGRSQLSSSTACAVRGNFLGLYIWFGWKMQTYTQGKVMLAYGCSLNKGA